MVCGGTEGASPVLLPLSVRMECEAVSDQAIRARVDAPQGLGVSDNVLQEILSTVRNTDGQLKKMGGELDETKQLSPKAVSYGYHYSGRSSEPLC